MARIENLKFNLSQAFQECTYIVPDYQREYVWTDKEVGQLLIDIDEQIDETFADEYFIGTILVSPTEKKDVFEVIDGQQRLTTLYLLLCALRNKFKGMPQYQKISGMISNIWTDEKGDDHIVVKLDPKYENASVVVSMLVELDQEPEKFKASIQAAAIHNYGSLENLLNAYATLYRYVDGLNNIDSLKKYYSFLVTKVVFIQIQLIRAVR